MVFYVRLIDCLVLFHYHSSLIYHNCIEEQKVLATDIKRKTRRTQLWIYFLGILIFTVKLKQKPFGSEISEYSSVHTMSMFYICTYPSVRVKTHRLQQALHAVYISKMFSNEM